MFSVTSNAGPAGQGTLRAVRLSLNTPVVAIAELPVGPASAGLALLEGPEGRCSCLAVRSVRSGQVVVFGPDEGWNAAAGAPLGLEAALSFAEGMGFLFEEDLVAAGDPEEAARRWAELLVGAAPPGASEPEGEAADAPPRLSKFRLRPGPIPVAAGPPAGRGELWLRFLSRL